MVEHLVRVKPVAEHFDPRGAQLKDPKYSMLSEPASLAPLAPKLHLRTTESTLESHNESVHRFATMAKG